MPFSQRIRGASFREEYDETFFLQNAEVVEDLSSATNRSTSSSSFLNRNTHIIPPKAKHLKHKLTVVLDLDETIVYARDGPLYVRPHIDELFRFLAAHCETIVWTSSIRRYADAVVSQVDKFAAVKHIVYRHPSWCGNQVKDLKLLGRDLESTLIIENTPDCMRGYEANGLLVEDYTGGELEDRTLLSLLNLLQDLVRCRDVEHLSVPEYLRRTRLAPLCRVVTDKGNYMECHCINSELEDTRTYFAEVPASSLLQSDFTNAIVC
ncbi:nuclear lim interactor-interacting factor [Strigomonas culicis]|uniref:Mitochondrial import inner membrane translocase subunit TIM50 n=1 Tax=Strigomonas culicis TaxID=28005 RepID=S9U7K0_9TRYP|nr:nuclear lim interactor-interacting factor [Strigomonas culicis]|eukprot:EPY24878.1 nuclear lim interactor-interacting factor [Strigomonas culicis]